MILDSISMNLEAVLAGAVSANQPEAHVVYSVWNSDGEETTQSQTRTALNGNSDVTILSAPSKPSWMLDVKELTIYNKDTASVTVTVKTDDGTERIIVKKLLLVGETLVYIKGGGWQIV